MGRWLASLAQPSPPTATSGCQLYTLHSHTAHLRRSPLQQRKLLSQQASTTPLPFTSWSGSLCDSCASLLCYLARGTWHHQLPIALEVCRCEILWLAKINIMKQSAKMLIRLHSPPISKWNQWVAIFALPLLRLVSKLFEGVRDVLLISEELSQQPFSVNINSRLCEILYTHHAVLCVLTSLTQSNFFFTTSYRTKRKYCTVSYERFPNDSH